MERSRLAEALGKVQLRAATHCNTPKSQRLYSEPQKVETWTKDDEG